MMKIIAEAAVTIGNSLALSLVFKTTVLTALALLAVGMSRRNRASVRHLLLASVFVVLLALPFAASFAPSIQLPVALAQEPLPATIVTASAASNTAPIAAKAALTTRETAGGARWSISTTALIAAGWVTGAMLFLLPVSVGLWELRRIRRTGLLWEHGQAILQTVAVKSGIKGHVDLLLHESIPGPMTCGLLRPAIVCPLDAQSWNKADLERAMVHELEHVRRRDCLTHAIARIVCALYWFHPLVWVAWRRLGLEAERACDDVVLRAAEATEYADQLVTLAKRMTSRAGMPTLGMASRSDLAMRVSAVLNAKQRRGQPSALATAMILTAALVLTVAISPLRAVQAPDAQLAFEVASVKRNVSGVQGGSFGARPGGNVVVVNYSLRNIIRNAWNLQDSHIVGGPEWQNEDRWDISAKAPEGQSPTPQQLMIMMRNLLADRFKLVVRNDTRDMPVYALVLARTDGTFGPQLRRTEFDCAPHLAAIEKGTPPPRSDSPPPCFNTRTGQGTLLAQGTRMADFARNLSPSTGRIVIDKTGLTGFFDIDLKFTPDQLRPGGAGDPAIDFPSLFVAIQEQLGLKLEAQRAPVEVLVIDSAQRPSEN